MKLTLFIFIDAFGWEILKAHPRFLESIQQDKRPLETIFGYSSACDPSMISGKSPSEHLHWSAFYYDPENSPFKRFWWLKWLPDWLIPLHRLRHRFSNYLAKKLQWTGYFEIYQIPFHYLSLFNYSEKTWFWGRKQGLNRGRSLFDDLIDKKIPFYVKENVHVSDDEQWVKVQKLTDEKKISFAWLFLGRLDAVMHAYGPKSQEATILIEEYDKKISDLIKSAKENYEDVEWIVFSDHGMRQVDDVIDLQSSIEALGLIYGKDYVAMYDASMARFWFLNENAKIAIESCLKKELAGDIVSQEQLEKWGVYFPDHQFGECIFLLKPGQLLLPSYVGLKPLKGMHGYHPDDPDSKAMIISGQPLKDNIQSIKDIRKCCDV